jgi:urease accessory protein
MPVVAKRRPAIEQFPAPAAAWRARLALAFERRAGRTVLASRTHEGPLVVQKPLYPEGEDICHAIVVHPPAGIAGGDDLAIAIRAAEGASILLTTPGAGKWYRSAGAWARQAVAIEAQDSASVEWLPQETILYDHCLADIRWTANLAGDARLIAWEIFCLGRTGSGERFSHGRCRLEMRIVRDGRLAWIERGRIEPELPVASSAAGLAGASVFATVIVAAPHIEDSWIAAARAVLPESGIAAVTRLPGLLLARYRGDSSEGARRYCTAVWSSLRQSALGREAIEPRIWRT